MNSRASQTIWNGGLLTNGKKTQDVRARGSLRSNDSIALLEAARAGIGILGAGEWLSSGGASPPGTGTRAAGMGLWYRGGIYIVRPSMRFPLARSQALVEWLGEQFDDGAPAKR